VRRPLAVALSLSLLVPAAAAPSTILAACDPATAPVYDPAVRPPTAIDGVGFDFGAEQMTVEDIGLVLDAIDADSDRVVTANAATSVDGLPIDYAIVGRPDRVTPEALADIRAGLAVLRDPLAGGPELTAALNDTPAVLWVAGNVHGGEESGADASLHALYELAARTDCVVQGVLDEAIVVVLPTQNPDGRAIGQRRNLYGFDMNRDWFARTQPETDGKLEVVRQYPPMLFIDAHEFGLSNYFFPPNADPEYHEIPDTAHDWINDLYSPAIVDAFEAEGIRYFHGAPYDFFAMIFGDTVPTAGYHAAGMTFEKESGDPIVEREHEQFTSIWASILAGATARDQVIAEWHASWVEAYEQGVDGVLEDNNVFEPGNQLYQPVPDVTVRHYFLLDDPARGYELQRLVRRLQRMDVRVERLTAPLSIDSFKPYGDPAGPATLPIGTYWIPLAQAQKHWVQALLHEESWIPVETTYDVTAWSNPLLMNLDGGWTGEQLSPVAAPVVPQPEPAWPAAAPADLSVVLVENWDSTRGYESANQLRYLFDEVWGLDHTMVRVDGIVGALGPDVDVLVIPDGYAPYVIKALGSKGKTALRDWVNAGGRIVAMQAGVEVAVKAGVSTVKLANTKTNMPGTLVRVSVDDASPLADGVGDQAWVMYQDDRILKPGLGAVVASYPGLETADHATSGLAIGVGNLSGTAAVVDEAVGSGRVVSFNIDPNFRAWTEGTQRILWNAIVGGDTGLTGLAAGSRARASAEKAATDAAAALLDFGSAIRIRVRAEDAAATARVLQRRGAEVVRHGVDSDVLFLVANRSDLSYDEHPFFTLVLQDLAKAGIRPRAASLP
jgi:hypothetical protein